MRHPSVDKRTLSVPRLALVAAVSAALSYQTPAIAQTRDASLVLEEIIVSAQKELENIQDIPATVNAINSDNIDDFKVLAIDDVSALVPGISFDRPDARRQTITVRGITSDPDNVASAPISLYINEQPVRTQEGFQAFFDVSLVEILRGPQGTLQGRTDPAGAVHVYTQRANTSSMDGYIQQTLQDNDGSNTQFGVSLPIIEDVLAVRVAGVYDDNEGQEIKNIVSGQEEQQRNKAGRFTVSWLPTDSIESTFTYMYSELDAGIPQPVAGTAVAPDAANNWIQDAAILGPTAQATIPALVPLVQQDPLGTILGLPTGTGLTSTISEQLGGLYFVRNQFAPTELLGPEFDLEDGDRKAIHKGINEALFRNELVTLGFDIDMDTFTISSITGYKESLSDNILDRDDGGVLPLAQLQQTITSVRARSQEIRFAFTEDEFWEYQFGLFWEKQETQTSNNVDASGSFGQIGAFDGLQQWDIINSLDIPVDRETFAVFLHNKFNLSDSTTLQVGVRWQEAELVTNALSAPIINYVDPTNGAQLGFDPTNGGDFFVPNYAALDVGFGAGLCEAAPGVIIPCSNLAVGALQGFSESLTNDGALAVFSAGLADMELIPEDLQETKESAITGGIKLQHYLDAADHETMIYASLDRSYRPPGVTITPSVLPADVLLFDEETSDSFEVGFKSTLQNGSLRVNGAAFIQKYDGYQARADVLNYINQAGDQEEVQGGVTFNADATITGVEMEFQKALASTWTIGGGVAYIDGTFDSGAEGPCNDTVQTGDTIAICDIGGQQVSAQPLWSGNLNSEYYIPMEGTEVYFRGLLSYRGESKNRLVEDLAISDYALLNIYAGVRSEDRVWDFSVWAKNAADTDRRADLKNVYETSLGQTDYRRSTMIAPRLLGMTLRYNFGL